MIEFDFAKIWQKYSKYSSIEFVCFSFRVGLLFYQLSPVFSSFNFSSFKPDAENNANFDAVSSKRVDFDEVHFFKHIPKLIILGTHNLQTFKHNTLVGVTLLTLINELLLSANAVLFI